MERKLGRKCPACLFLSASNTCLHKFCLQPEYDCHSAQRRPSCRNCFFKKRLRAIYIHGPRTGNKPGNYIALQRGAMFWEFVPQGSFDRGRFPNIPSVQNITFRKGSLDFPIIDFKDFESPSLFI